MRINFKRLTIVCGLLLLSLGSTASNLPDFTVLVEENRNAVVNISTTQKVTKHSSLPQGFDIPEGSPYSELFKHFFDAPGQMPRQRDARSLGSGFIISKDGYLLTNHHVVNGADEIIVRLQDRRELKARLVGSDKRTDVALLKIEANDLPVIKFGSSKALKVGEWVFAIGSPFGFDSSVTAGIVSAKGRSLPKENYVPFIQTDVAINPGNSGGPLFNLAGEVVGINSQIYSRSGGFMGLSFAIPIDVALNVSQQLKNTGKVVRGWLGVRIQDVTRELAESFGMDKPYGALVAQVVNNSPAEKAGLQLGDIIVEFNGQEVGRSSVLPPLVGATSISSVAKLKIIRHKETKMIQVQLEGLPADEAVQVVPNKSLKPNAILGLLVTDLTADMRKNLKIKQGGIIVESVANEMAVKAGVRPGDVILQFGGQKVKGVKDFKRLANKMQAGKFVSVLINRQGQPIFLALKK